MFESPYNFFWQPIAHLTVHNAQSIQGSTVEYIAARFPVNPTPRFSPSIFPLIVPPTVLSMGSPIFPLIVPSTVLSMGSPILPQLDRTCIQPRYPMPRSVCSNEPEYRPRPLLALGCPSGLSAGAFSCKVERASLVRV